MRLNKILKVFPSIDQDILSAFNIFDEEVLKLKEELNQSIRMDTLEMVNSQMEDFKKRINLTPLTEEMDKISSLFKDKSNELQSQIEEKTRELNTAKQLMSANESEIKDKIKTLSSELSSLKTQLTALEGLCQTDFTHLELSISGVEGITRRIDDTINQLTQNLETRTTKKETEKTVKDTQDKIDELRRDVLNRIANIGGGAMNRQMFIGGVDPLKTYTDMNLKAGANVTITYANNNTTKKVDVTFAATGGGGGSVRSINSVSSNTNAGATAGTDYVYLCSGTMTLTMPDAAANTNLYTIKNVGTGVLTIATTSSQTIDGTTTITMPVQYTAVDLISDSANWAVT